LEYLFTHPWILGLLLAIALGTFLDLGRAVAKRARIDQVSERKEQISTIRDGLFVLLSLLLGFTLTLAAARYVERRSLLVEEAVSIGVTYLRASTLPATQRDHSKQLLREYVDSRLELNAATIDPARFDTVLHRSSHLQQELWSEATAAVQNDRSAIAATYIQSLNETIDLHEKRVAAFEHRVPQPIWVLIVCVSLLAVFSRGCTLTSRFWLTLMIVPVTITIVVSLIADLDTPSRGLIRLDDRALQRLKAEMK
jgi:hypothetical protein